MATNKVLAQIKRDLEPLVGHRIRIKANKGRKKIIEREGILERTYPHIFVIRLEEEQFANRRISYSYTDILTEAVELSISPEGGPVKIEKHSS